jgi:SAM-dependent methyltransferase
MNADDWLEDTRTSYDTVADSYAGQLRDALAGKPYLRAALALFADLARAAGGGPVADMGCGPGHVTAHLHEIGIDAFGIDLSPAMIDVARREHPGLRFEVGSMTDIGLADASVAALLAFWSLIHIPDDAIPSVFSHFRRVLRPGGPVLLGFHVGDQSRLKTQGYGGHPMKVYVHRRQPAQVAAWLRDAGFTVEAQMLLDPDDSNPGAVLFARRQPAWGYGAKDPEPFSKVIASEAGRDGLPISLVAVDPAGDALGKVGLAESDGELSQQERAAAQGFRQLWVATGDEAVGFYRRCG